MFFGRRMSQSKIRDTLSPTTAWVFLTSYVALTATIALISGSHETRSRAMSTNRPAGNDLTSSYNIAPENVYAFTTMPKIEKLLNDMSDTLERGSSTVQYVAITGVNDALLTRIDRKRDSRACELPPMRVLYDATLNTLIIKLKPGPYYEAMRVNIEDFVKAKVNGPHIQIGPGQRRIFSCGSIRSGVVGGRMKEPDASFRPSTRRAHEWPSLVVELGISESFKPLRRDAEYWLTESGGGTRVVLLVALQLKGRHLIFEQWENRPKPRPSHRAPATRPTKTHHFTLDDTGANTAGTGQPTLFMPHTLLLDAPYPSGLVPTDFTFSTADFTSLVRLFWEQC